MECVYEVKRRGKSVCEADGKECSRKDGKRPSCYTFLVRRDYDKARDTKRS